MVRAGFIAVIYVDEFTLQGNWGRRGRKLNQLIACPACIRAITGSQPDSDHLLLVCDTDNHSVKWFGPAVGGARARGDINDPPTHAGNFKIALGRRRQIRGVTITERGFAPGEFDSPKEAAYVGPRGSCPDGLLIVRDLTRLQVLTPTGIPLQMFADEIAPLPCSFSPSLASPHVIYAQTPLTLHLRRALTEVKLLRLM